MFVVGDWFLRKETLPTSVPTRQHLTSNIKKKSSSWLTFSWTTSNENLMLDVVGCRPQRCPTSSVQHQTQYQCHCLAIGTVRVRWQATNGATSNLALDALPKWREDCEIRRKLGQKAVLPNAETPRLIRRRLGSNLDRAHGAESWR
jgi:hypothetical protein